MRTELPQWPFALGGPLGKANYRQRPEDFQVDEVLGFSADGEGPHQLLQVRKRGANTAFVAQVLAKHAGVAERDIGYAGLKDRHAITSQFFSVPTKPGTTTDWEGLAVDGVEVLQAQPHRRKLRRGAHRGNRFRIVLRDIDADTVRIEQRLEQVSETGVPNYFGVQRFGRDGGNLDLAEALVKGARLPPNKRGFAISTMRSLLFNEVLGLRVAHGSWNKALPGELLNLDGRGSWFRYSSDDTTIAERLAQLQIHPTGPLIGKVKEAVEAEVGALENQVLESYPGWLEALQRLQVEADRRALRIRVQELSYTWLQSQVLALSFELSSGAYATSVMRELLVLEDVHGLPEPGID